ncbi:methylmalonyl-CoA epimerase [Sphingopyxis sp. LC81]|uniref:VOC family protein n=1 Tax=Sphingopyxis sp. LC81 TaxID=1502850 RepID=UPI00050F0AC0|nr:VOC family protein [Sphingopyxis sp. LC81]KGB53271.1 methylmalonyl-CoA epimerase [Sphingopyxis sp. LC81]
MPRQSLAHIALVVREYDEAIDFYVGTLGFTLVADEYQPAQGKRWVLVAPPGNPPGGATILLARASNEEQVKYIGDQAGGRVFLFLETDDFACDYQRLLDKGVRIEREPLEAEYGTVAVFLDLYGNKWDLIEFRRAE